MADRPKRGQRLKAKHLTDIQEGNRRNEIISSANVYLSRSPLGTAINTTSKGTETFWIQLTSAGVGTAAGRYAWSYATRTVGGWTIGSVGGTLASNWAQEANDFAGLGVVFVEVRRIGGRVLFQLESCP